MQYKVSSDELKQHLASRETADKWFAEFWNGEVQRWRQFAGPCIDAMLEARDSAFNQLNNEDAKVRSVALAVLAYHWKATVDCDFVQRCEDIAVCDPDESVRAAALRLLGECYANSDDPRVGKFLAVIVGDEGQRLEPRSGAYFGLFRLRGRFADWPGRMNTPGAPFQFAEHVDWSFVNSFRNADQMPNAVDKVAQTLSFLPKDTIEGFRHYQKGVEAVDKRQYESAIVFFSRAIEFLPEASGAYGMRSRAYSGLEKLDEAIADLTRSIELSPNVAASYVERGQAYAKKGLRDQAEQDFQLASKLRKES